MAHRCLCGYGDQLLQHFASDITQIPFSLECMKTESVVVTGVSPATLSEIKSVIAKKMDCVISWMSQLLGSWFLAPSGILEQSGRKIKKSRMELLFLH